MASPYGLMDGHELGAIRKRAFDLDLLDHASHTFHYCVARKNCRPNACNLRDGLAVADKLEDFGGNERDGFRMVKRQATGAPFSRQFTGVEDEEFLDLACSQVHETSLTRSCLRRRKGCYAASSF